MSDLKYLRGYPEPLLAQVRQLIAEDRLGDYLARRYPGRHQVQSDKALYGYVQQLKQDHLKSAPPIDNDRHHAGGARRRAGYHQAEQDDDHQRAAEDMPRTGADPG